MDIHISFDNTYTHLPPLLYASLEPTAVAAPRLVQVNAPLAEDLGIDPDELTSPEGIEVLAGNRLPDGAASIALAYAGHQIGHFVPQLGDGRALLLGEIVGGDGRRHDLQLKGAGRTPFSRDGDGRGALGPVLREYTVSEAMSPLGVPTTRALAAVTTGQPVRRETMQPGAILTRVAASHIRVGTFQYVAARGDVAALRLLADHVIARHYPEAAAAEHPYRALLDGVVARQAELIAHWMLIGFIHGVMNTDNTSISGETIDYGPCAFMDHYDPAQVFSSIDELGRYAYANQPRIALWNLTRLAECLLPLMSDDQEKGIAEAQDILGAFPQEFSAAYQAGLRNKIGLFTARDGDEALVQDLLDAMAQARADFTLTFRHLGDAASGDPSNVRALFAEPTPFDEWVARWQKRIADEPQSPRERQAAMRAVNPAFIPRNHRIEAMIAAATNDDYAPFEELLKVLARPYDDQPEYAAYADPPRPEERVCQTFCGT